MKFSLSLLLAAAIPASDAQTVVSLHGSGTTNPQKCYWDIMDTLMKQAKLPIRMTYRGVGSSTGQAEFMGTAGLSPFNDFGSGDIPFSEENFNKFKSPMIQGQSESSEDEDEEGDEEEKQSDEDS